ncbi:hypothetical protein V6Z11_A12G116300 [Gossypium hirsutum]
MNPLLPIPMIHHRSSCELGGSDQSCPYPRLVILAIPIHFPFDRSSLLYCLVENLWETMAAEDGGELYLRYYVGHKGKFGHEFLSWNSSQKVSSVMLIIPTKKRHYDPQGAFPHPSGSQGMPPHHRE